MAHPKRTRTAIPVFGLSVVLMAGLCPTPALAVSSSEIQQQLNSAQDKLYSLYSAAEQAGNDYATVSNDLNATLEQIDQTSAEIEKEEQQLAAFQEELSGLVTSQYKSGGSANIVSALLSSGSFTSLISNLHYADKAAEHKQDVITGARELMASLEQKRSDLEEQKEKQEKLVGEQAAKMNAAQAAADEAQAYYDQLSDDLKQAIAAEEEAARKAAEEEAARQQAQQQSGGSSTGNSGSTGNSDNTGNSGNTGSSGNSGSTGNSGNSGNSGGSNSGNSGSTGGGSTGGNVSNTPTSSANAMVARAQSVIGSGYSYTGYKWTGSTSTSYFTCSGLVDYALGYGPWSNSPESYLASVKARGTFTTSVSQLKYGDLVFFSSGGRYCGHVGIYIGGGSMIDSIPGAGVGYRTLSYIGGFLGGGSII